jgi:hypothetical protein
MTTRGRPLDGGCQVIIQKAYSWTIVGNGFGEYVHCSHCKRLNRWSLKKSPYFSNDSQKSLTPLTHPFSNFYIVFVYHWTCYRPERSWNTSRWTLNNNRSINQSCSSEILILFNNDRNRSPLSLFAICSGFKIVSVMGKTSFKILTWYLTNF